MRIISKIEKHLVSNLVDNSMIQGIIKPAKDCLEDSKFWINQEESLVIFMAENFFEYYQLPVPTELAIYIDTEFKVTPLASMMENTPLHKTEKVKHQISRLEVIQKIA